MTMCELPLARIRQVDDIDAAARGFENRGVVDAALADLRPPGMLFGIVAIKNQDGRRLYGLHLVSVAAERRLDSNERLDLVGSRLEHLVAERPRLAVHQHHARADFVHELDIGGDDLIIGGEPARHALLHELLVGLDRKLDAGIGRALGLVVVPRSGRADPEALPRIAQRQCHRVALEGVGPAGAAALHGVGDIGVPALADEIGEPAFAAIRLGLVGHAGQSAAVPQQERHFALAVLRQKVLHVHLLDLILAVGVHLRGNAAGREHDLFDWLAGDLDHAAANVKRTHLT
jgi:hypothetical protein